MQADFKTSSDFEGHAVEHSCGALKRVLLGSVCLPIAFFALPTNALAQSAEVGADANDIVVTATRRTLRVSDIPMSISALPQETLAARGIRDVRDLAYAAPGLSVISANDGTETVSVRGIVALGVVPTTALYIDETPISQSGGGKFTPRYFDIERVEVLRGPQGTLFGASAMGGAIRVISKRPNLSQFVGAVRAEGSTTHLAGGNFIGDAAVSVPIVDDVLALRVTGYYEKQSGWAQAFVPQFSDNPDDYFTPDGEQGIAYRGVTGPGRRVGGEALYGARASLLLQPVAALQLTATYQWQKRKNEGFSSADNSIGLGLSGENLRQARSTDERRDVTSQIVNLTGEFDASFAKLTTSTSYEWNRENYLVDLGAFLLPSIVGNLGVLPRDAAGRAGASQLSFRKRSNFTQEARLVSSGTGAFNWIIGGFYNRSVFDQTQSYLVRGIEATVAGSPLDGLVPGDSVGVLKSSDTLREISVFGEAGYKFSDRLGVTLGLRRYSVQTGLDTLTTGLIGNGAGPVRLRSRENGLTYKAVLNYKPNENLLMFASYTSGYRPGGPNIAPFLPQDVIPPSFKSDKLSQYELGWKTSWLNRKLTVNGAIFYIDWTDIPTDVNAFSGVRYTINGPKARNYGAELEIVIRPTSGLDFSFDVTVLNAKYSADFIDPSGSGVRIVKGQALPNVPDVTLNAAINYEWSMGSGTRARIGGNIIHVSKRSQTANDLVAPLPGFVNAGLSAGVSFGKFDVSVFARNVFDTRALIGNTPIGKEVVGSVTRATTWQSYLQPRTLGASVQVKF